jgi:hypothetical protein
LENPLKEAGFTVGLDVAPLQTETAEVSMNLSKTVLLASWIGATALLSPAYAEEPSTLDVAYRIEGDVPNVTGGIGADQVAGLLAHARDYDLKVVFALQPTHAYVTDVPVRIFAATGKEILATDHAGPLLFANLPSGEYRIETERRGTALMQTAKVVEGRQTKIAFYWRDPFDGAPEVSAPRVNAKSSVVAPRPAMSTATDREIPLPGRGSDRSAGPLGLKVERLWTSGGLTYAALSLHNTTNESLVKIDVACEFSGRGMETSAGARQTVLSPSENPMLPGTVRNATVLVGKSETVLQPVACEAHAL